MMTEILVDPALFRLRAFEVEWLEPLKTELSDLSARSVESTPERGRTTDSDSSALLLYVLIAEADRWLTMGQQLGYFAPTSASAYPLPLAEPSQLQWLLGAIRSESALPPGLGAREFSRALSEARDGLTAERREFLRLVCFAEEVEWLERLNQIRTFAEQLVNQPAEFPSEIVDGVAWGLDGFGWDTSDGPIYSPATESRGYSPGSSKSGPADTEMLTTDEFQQHLPAEWRSGWLSLVAKRSAVAGRRLAALAEVRTSIAATLLELTQMPPVGPPPERSQTKPETLHEASLDLSTRGRGVGRRSDRLLQVRVDVVDSEPDVVERLVEQLRVEQLRGDLDVEIVMSADAPLGTRADPVTLLVTAMSAGGALRLIKTARNWLARHAAARRISVTIDGDTIVLEEGWAQEQSALIEAYLARHEVE